MLRQVMAEQQTGPRRRQRGAALLISIAILTILVAIGLTFFSVSRLDLRTATNATNAVRVDMLDDAANNIAIHALNQYFFRHPDVTSNDHSFRSQFEGSWAAGKSWARHRAFPGDTIGQSLISGGVPELDANRIKEALERAAQLVAGNGRKLPVMLVWPDGHREEIFRGPRSNEWLFIPRFQGGLTPGNPFQPDNPDFILIYDDQVELRIEDPGVPGGTFLADFSTGLAGLNAQLAAISPDVRFAYFDEAPAAFPFVTPAVYRSADPAAEGDPYYEGVPFALPPEATGFPEEVIDAIADVDNDGDGQRDSIWIPIPQDEFFPSDEIDNDLDGMIDELQDNRINDDRDVYVAGGNLLNRTDYAAVDASGEPLQDPDGVILHDDDESIETGALIYNGLGPLVETEAGFVRIGDGLDNDGDGLTDDPSEDRLFLTSPLPGIRISLDLDGDGASSTVEKFTYENTANELVQVDVLNAAIILPDTIYAPRRFGDGARGPVVAFDLALTVADVDVLDNDYDQLVNDYHTYAYLGPLQPGSYNGSDATNIAAPGWQPVGNWDNLELMGPTYAASTDAYAKQITKSYSDIHRDVWINGATLVGTWVDPDDGQTKAWPAGLPGTVITALENSIRVTHSGEPVCTLVGRAAIRIADEASKVNLNVAGAERYDIFKDPDRESLMSPALGGGLSPAEYDLRVIPGFDVALASKIAGYRAGAPAGMHLPRDTDAQVNTEYFGVVTTDGSYNPAQEEAVYPYRFDISLPGYGRVDDNGNALLSAIDRVDNDGDGITDGGLLPLGPERWPTSFDEVAAYKDFLSGNASSVTELALGTANGFTDPLQLRFAQYYFRLGQFEGIDEPDEYQRFSPLANALAENDLGLGNIALDNDGIAGGLPADEAYNFANEAGEFGDTFFQTRAELQRVNQIGGGRGAVLNRVGTMHSTDKNLAFVNTEAGIRGLNKIDINRASSKQLAARLLLANDLESPLDLIDTGGVLGLFDNTPWTNLIENTATLDLTNPLGFVRAVSPARYAQGLRNAGLRLAAHNPNAGADKRGGMLYTRAGVADINPLDIYPAAMQLPLDPQLQALQLAANITDTRDANYARSILTTENIDLSQDDEIAGNIFSWPQQNDLNAREIIEAARLFPMEEIQDQLESVLNTTEDARPLQINDEWWRDRVFADFDTNTQEQRKISYTAAGTEAVRINELMVRPVRRVEAEAVPDQLGGTPATDPVALTAGPPSYANLDPSPYNEYLGAIGTVTGEVPNYYASPGTFTYLAGAGDALMPEFAIQRDAIVAAEMPLPLGPLSILNTSWGVPGGGAPLIGESTTLQTSGLGYELELLYESPPGTPRFLQVPDIIQFEFSDTDLGGFKDGLPVGRYYLTAKLEDVLGATTVAELVAAGRLHYTIKYVPIGGADVKDDLRARIGDIASTGNFAAQSAAVGLLEDYFKQNWERVNPQHLAHGPGEPENWLFIDPQPSDISRQNSDFDPEPGYFMEWPPAASINQLGVNVRFNSQFVAGAWDYTINFRIDAAAVLPAGNYTVQLRDGGGPVQTFTVALGGGISFGSVKRLVADGNGLSDADMQDLINGGQIRLSGPALPAVTYDLNFGSGATDNENTHTVGLPDTFFDAATGTTSGYQLIVAFTTSELFDPASNGIAIAGNYPAASAPPNTSAPLGINFFDFSQEPDHEWIEVANVSDDVVDLSNWSLEVGPPTTTGVDFTPFNTQWRVPAGTQIAPGGMVLLSFAKYDAFDTPGANSYPPFMPDADHNLLGKNGMGLARSSILYPLTIAEAQSTTNNGGDPIDNLDLSHVTVPPIFDTSNEDRLYDPALSWMFDLTGSVFDREYNPLTPAIDSRADYVDAFGAGISTTHALQGGLPQVVPGTTQFTQDYQQAINEAAVQSTPNLRLGPNQPFDRIVQLQNVRLWHQDSDLYTATSEARALTTADLQSVDDIARMVLRGGILPNYPDHDGYDNDGDGGYLNNASRYVPGTLEKDMVDNDLDGFIDETPALLADTDFDGLADASLWAGANVTFDTIFPALYSGEGVDEGNLGLFGAVAGTYARPYGPGSFAYGTLPVRFANDRTIHDNARGIGTVAVQDAAIVDVAVEANATAGIAYDTYPNTTVDTSSASQIVIQNTTTPVSGFYRKLAEIDLTALTSRWEKRQVYAINVTSSQRCQLVFPGTTNIDPLIELPDPFSGAFSTAEYYADFTDSISTVIEIWGVENDPSIILTNFTIRPIGTTTEAGISNAVDFVSATGAVFQAGNGNTAYTTAFGQTYLGEPAPMALNEDALYLGSDLDPPDWKAFTERRFYPGDNVVVSLYDSEGNVADRVTYNEYDVINRTIDDVVESPYQVTNFHAAAVGTEGLEDVFGVNPAVVNLASLNPAFPSMWLPNQMGLDFYRSLERKSPLDPGDRFGTSNRWEATDGNYDDWSDSLSVFARTRLLGIADNYQAVPQQNTLTGSIFAGGSTSPVDLLEFSRFYSQNLRDFAALRTNTEDHRRLYGHAMAGTPLRMNTAYRIATNPLDQFRAGALQDGAADIPLVDNTGTVPVSQAYAQFYSLDPINYRPDFIDASFAGAEDTRLASASWENRVDYTPVTNTPFSSGLDIARVPLVTREHYMFNGARGRVGSENFYHDVTGLNFYTNAAGVRAVEDVSQRSVLAMQQPDRVTGSTGETPLKQAGNTFSTNSLVLTVAQADFRPIRPRLFDAGASGLAPREAISDADLPEGQSRQNLLQWFPPPGASGTSLLDPPAAWSPVYLYAVTDSGLSVSGNNGGADVRAPELDMNGIFPATIAPFDDFGEDLSTNQRDFPFYPAYVDGRASGLRIDPLPALLRPQFIFSPDPANVWSGLTFANLAPNEIQQRSPLKNRVVMYVSKPRDLAPGGVPMSDDHRPEGLWVWDAEDGLENGEYEVYIGTYMPGLTDNLSNVNTLVTRLEQAAANGDPTAEALLPTYANPDDPQDSPVLTSFARSQILPRDSRDTEDSSAKFRAVFNIDVITDRTLAQGQRSSVSGNPAPLVAAEESFGLVHPYDWQPAITYRANEDGYVFYGADAADGWQPIIVRVTDNFLALRVRNAGDRYDIGAISHIVLAPRKRTPGRINVNTANMTSVQAGGSDYLWHSLLGAPGMIDLGGDIRFQDLDESGASVNPAEAPSDTTLNRWRSPSDLMSSLAVPFVPGTGTLPLPVAQAGGYEVRSTLSDTGITDAAALARVARYQSIGLLQRARTEHPDGRYYESPADLLSEDISLPQDPVAAPDNRKLHPLTVNTIPEERAGEILRRFGELGSSITTRSDVFEILVTVQSGYGVDANNDGYLNYRDNNEFITNAETRSRMVYERRTPADNSDESASK
ncbi:MAG: hypothetical protein GC168_18280 [Candidatus Hydrogenedens sp.]|nr:hypothetical protein [Candidatus Hydrogenedens sp.]